ncbi:MAG: bifunctional 4-hydroxy-2-oxoglutarate aldolase/2-dehydro-3-deoxy-phosphogluconate aldolase [Acidobacteriota bacterium]
MNDAIIDQFGELGVVPVIVIEDPEDAVPLAEALMRAGLPALEVTFRTAVAAEALERIKRRFPDLFLGAGTVLTAEQVRKARDSGASFVISPGLDARLVEFCLEQGLTPFPGVCSPSEIQAALGLGLNVLKFFPSEAMGGLEYLRAVSGPFPMVRFIPTGGINTRNLADYLSFDRVLACAGTWIARRQWLSQKRFDLIEKEAAEAVRIVGTVRQGGNRA